MSIDTVTQSASCTDSVPNKSCPICPDLSLWIAVTVASCTATAVMLIFAIGMSCYTRSLKRLLASGRRRAADQIFDAAPSFGNTGLEISSVGFTLIEVDGSAGATRDAEPPAQAVAAAAAATDPERRCRVASDALQPRGSPTGNRLQPPARGSGDARPASPHRPPLGLPASAAGDSEQRSGSVAGGGGSGLAEAVAPGGGSATIGRPPRSPLPSPWLPARGAGAPSLTAGTELSVKPLPGPTAAAAAHPRTPLPSPATNRKPPQPPPRFAGGEDEATSATRSSSSSPLVGVARGGADGCSISGSVSSSRRRSSSSSSGGGGGSADRGQMLPEPRPGASAATPQVAKRQVPAASGTKAPPPSKAASVVRRGLSDSQLDDRRDDRGRSYITALPSPDADDYYNSADVLAVQRHRRRSTTELSDGSVEDYDYCQCPRTNRLPPLQLRAPGAQPGAGAAAGLDRCEKAVAARADPSYANTAA